MQDGFVLPLKDQGRSLGIILDTVLLLDKQVAAVVRSASYQLRLVMELQPFLEQGDCASITHALVKSPFPLRHAWLPR